MTIKKWIFSLVAFVLFATGCSADQPKLPRLAAGQTIVAFGDSLTYGMGAGTDESYPADLEKRIKYRVINAGIPGETTDKSIERLPSVLDEYHPALVILCIGGNDLLHKKTDDAIEKNLTTLVDMIQSSGASVVLIGVPRPGIWLSVPDFYAQVAKKKNIPVDIALLQKLLMSLDYKSDAIHLNAAGYAQLANGIAEFLKKCGAI